MLLFHFQQSEKLTMLVSDIHTGSGALLSMADVDLSFLSNMYYDEKVKK